MQGFSLHSCVWNLHVRRVLKERLCLHLDEPPLLDLVSLVPDLSSYDAASNEDSNLAVILSLLESDPNMAQLDTNVGQNIMEDSHWSL